MSLFYQSRWPADHFWQLVDSESKECAKEFGADVEKTKQSLLWWITAHALAAGVA